MKALGVIILCMYTSVHSHMLWQERAENSSFRRLYPITDFNRLEIFCKNFWSDLDILEIQEDLRKQMSFCPDYLHEQFVLLDQKLEALVNNKEEAASFLIEDVQYIGYMVAIIEKKYRDLDIMEQLPSVVAYRIDTMLEHAKQQVVSLYTMNKERYKRL